MSLAVPNMERSSDALAMNRPKQKVFRNSAIVSLEDASKTVTYWKII
jgi:hypothetical protein